VVRGRVAVVIHCGRPVGPLELWGAYTALGPAAVQSARLSRLVPAELYSTGDPSINWVLPAVARITRLRGLLACKLAQLYAVSKVLPSVAGSEDIEAAGSGVLVLAIRDLASEILGLRRIAIDAVKARLQGNLAAGLTCSRDSSSGSSVRTRGL
jgi:hypothetical protein